MIYTLRLNVPTKLLLMLTLMFGSASAQTGTTTPGQVAAQIAGQAIAPLSVATAGTTAGFWEGYFGTDSSGVAPCSTALTAGGICDQAPTSGTSYVKVRPGTGSTGMPLYTYTGGSPNVLVETISTALPNGQTAVTQAVNDTTAKVATMAAVTGYVGGSSMVTSITGADYTCGTGGTHSVCTSATTVMSFTLPLVALNWHFECSLYVGQATAATANQWLIQTATNGATSMTVVADIRTASATSALLATTDQATTTTAVEIGGATWTLGATGTKMLHRISGTIEGASASGTVLNLQVIAPTVADLLTIYRGSSCRVW